MKQNSQSATGRNPLPGAVPSRQMDFLLLALLCAVLYWGNRLVAHPLFGVPHALWDLVDAPVHFVVGVLVAAPIALAQPDRRRALLVALLAGAGAALIDVDHAIASGSLSLYVIDHLPKRPITHSMAFALLCGLLAWAATRKPSAGWLLFAILMSHIIRDASYGRVDYFFWPFPSFHRLLPPFYYFGAEICLYLVSKGVTQAFGAAWPGAVTAPPSQRQQRAPVPVTGQAVRPLPAKKVSDPED
jgi:membrane-bound metal-dependent hydrolase YbcI (DUF457 family)